MFLCRYRSPFTNLRFVPRQQPPAFFAFRGLGAITAHRSMCVCARRGWSWGRGGPAARCLPSRFHNLAKTCKCPISQLRWGGELARQMLCGQGAAMPTEWNHGFSWRYILFTSCVQEVAEAGCVSSPLRHTETSFKGTPWVMKVWR